MLGHGLAGRIKRKKKKMLKGREDSIELWLERMLG